MFLIAAVPFMFLGIAILVSLRTIYGNRLSVADDMLVIVLSVAGWTLFLMGVAMMVTPFAMIVVLLIAGMTVARFRDGERRALLWTLAVAADKGMPLAASARAFGARRCDEMARRAWLLADQLDSGIPLQVALENSGNPLPDEATLMVRLGADPAVTATALYRSADSRGLDEDEWRPVFERTIYLLLVVGATVAIASFLMVKVVPTFKQIFSDFGTELPVLTQLTIALANKCAQWWFLTLPFVWYMLIVGLIAAYFYAQGKIWIPWPFGWLFGNSSSSTALRGLAVCIDRQMPIDQALSRVGFHMPNVSVGRKLTKASVQAAGGQDWCDSLNGLGVISAAESAVLKSATRAGNLAWALREMAEVKTRRQVYRARLLLNIITPVCLILLAIPVAMLAIGCFLPLISLIQNLA